MSADIVELKCVTSLEIPPDRILNRAIESGLKSVIIIGETEDGQEYFCSSIANGPDVVWQIERAKLRLLRTVDGDGA